MVIAEKGEAMIPDERGLHEWLGRVRAGSLGRREFTRILLASGLTPPLIAELLRSRGIANAQLKRETFTPSRRGGGGDLKMLWWQAPTILNPHLAIGVKDDDGSRLTAESGSHTVVTVAKAPRFGLPTDGVSRAAQVGWVAHARPALYAAASLIDPPRPPRYRRRT